MKINNTSLDFIFFMQDVLIILRKMLAFMTKKLVFHRDVKLIIYFNSPNLRIISK